MAKATEQTIDQRFPPQVQAFYISCIIADIELYQTCFPELKTEYFDDNFRPLIREIHKYFEATNQLPSAAWLNAKFECSSITKETNINREYLISEIESFAQIKAHESIIYKGMDYLNSGDFVKLWQEQDEARLITLTNKEEKWATASIDNCFDTPPAEWLVEGFWQHGTICNLYSESNLGKTWLALDIALRIATPGFDWHGIRINRKGGKVLYIGAEAGNSAKRRAADWAALYNVRNRIRDFGVITTALDLLDKAAVAQFVKAHSKTPTECLFIDTLACSMGSGENENSNNEMAWVVEALKALASGLGCSVMVLHHPTKQGGTERGGGAYKAGVDTSLKLTLDDVLEDGDILKLDTEKQRDGERLVRYFKKQIVQSKREPNKTTIQISPYDMKKAKQDDIWNHLSETLAISNDQPMTKLLQIINMGKKPSGRQVKQLKAMFVDGKYESSGLIFTLNDKGIIHLVTQ